MKKKILDLLEEAEKPLAFGQIRSRIRPSNASKYNRMVRALNELLEENKIEFTDHNEYRLKKVQKRYLTGTLRLARNLNGFIDRPDGSGLYIPAGLLGGAMDLDTVKAEILEDAKGEYGAVEEVLVHAHEYLSGTLSKNRRKVVFEPEDKRLINPVVILNPKEFPASSDQKVLLKIEEYGEILKGRIIRLLGEADDPLVKIRSILAGYGISDEYPREALEEAQRRNTEITEQEKKERHDLTALPHITIDGADAQDFDDAVCLISKEDSCTLYVSIADVSWFVPQGSAIDEEAFRRSTSVYYLDKAVNMLPDLLADDLCSLKENCVRRALTCEMQFDENGRQTGHVFYPSLIRCRKRMTYDEAMRILDGESVPGVSAELSEMLKRMRQLSGKIRELRHQAGEVEFESAEPSYTTGEDGFITAIRAIPQDDARKLIEDFMISANTAAAQVCAKEKIPCLYRIHDKPPVSKMQDFIRFLASWDLEWPHGTSRLKPLYFQQLLSQIRDTIAYPSVSSMALRTMAKACYSEKCLPHFGLALEEYIHFTSPIRRYPDLLTHRMMRRYLFEGKKEAAEEDRAFAAKAAVQTSFKERAAQSAERAVEDYMTAEYMKQNIGTRYEATIRFAGEHGMTVRLDNTVEGSLPLYLMEDDFYTYDEHDHALHGKMSGKTYRAGQKVPVQCAGADPYTNSIVFRLEQEEQANGE